MPSRRPPTKSPRQDPVEAKAEEDVARMRDLLKRTRAEVERANRLVEAIERRKKKRDDS